MLAQIRRFARRFALMLSGEAMQSVFHLAFNIALLHVLPVRDYGIFAAVLLIGGLALTYVRALAGTPAILFIPAAPGRRAALALDVSFGSGALALSVFIGAGVASGLHFWIGKGALAGGAFVGLWSLRAYLRTAFFARREQGYAGLSDFVFTLSGGLLAAVLLRGAAAGADVLESAFFVLASANALAIATALLCPFRRIRVSFGRAMRARFARLWPQLGWATLGVTAGNLQAQGQVLLVIMLAGPAAYAPIAAMLVFFAPLRLLAFALANVMQPEIATLLARDDRDKIRELLPFWSLTMLALAGVYGIAALAALPLISAPVFAGQPKTLLWLFAWSVSTMPLLYIMPKMALEVNRSFRNLAIIAGVSAVAGMALGSVLLTLATPVWSLAGILAGETVVLCSCWLAVGKIDARRRNPPGLVAAEFGDVLP